MTDSPRPELDMETQEFVHQLFDLARQGNSQRLEQLLQQGLPPNLRNHKGDSLLMLASYHGHADTVRLLLAYKADPDLRNLAGQTPLAGALTALGIGITVLLFTPLFHNLPHAVLAATIIIAVLSLVDLSALRRTWRYSRQDAAAMAATMLGVLLIGVESGILLGVGLSLLLFLWRTSQPHIAVVGQLPGSEHFRNVERFAVVQSPRVLSVRVDESLYFPNARFLEDRIAELIGRHPQAEHLVLMCPGVNLIDASALESLEAITARLHAAGIQLHLSEVKGPVMDRLRHSDFLSHFGGQVFISQYEALLALDPDTTFHALERPRERFASIKENAG